MKRIFFFSIDILPLQRYIHGFHNNQIKSATNAQQKNRYACANKIELSRALFFFFFFLPFYQNSPQGVKVNPRYMYFIRPISIPSQQWKRKIDRPIKRYDTREIYGPTHKCLHNQTWTWTSACTREQRLKASSIKLFESLHSQGCKVILNDSKATTTRTSSSLAEEIHENPSSIRNTVYYLDENTVETL